MITKITGTITSIFSDDINTDDIIPAWTLQESGEKSFFKKYAFANYDKKFIDRCSKQKNNIIIAGDNFGCGSSREQAVYALTENGITAVIAKSFPDIFYRNAINNGLIPIVYTNTSKFELNEKLIIDLKNKIIVRNGEKTAFTINNEDVQTIIWGDKLGQVRTTLTNLLKSEEKKLSHQIGKKRNEDNNPQTIVEKIISAHIMEKVFASGHINKLPIDILFLNEVIGPPVIKDFKFYFDEIFEKLHKKIKVFNNKKIFLIPDHTVPSSSVSVSEGITLMEEFAKEQSIRCYKEGDGIEHVVLIEDGFIVPGEIILGTDSHTDTNGALNTFAIGVGTTDATYALATGFLYDFEVPKTIRVNMKGKFKKGVYAKDLILHLIGQLGVDGASRKVIEFGGSALKNISMDSRTTIANMSVEAGARTAIFEYDNILEKYLKNRAKFVYQKYLPDKNARYEKKINVDLALLEPNISFPHKPSNVTSVTELKTFMRISQKSKNLDFAPVDSLKITDAFLGACTNGRYEDFIAAAKIMKGRKVHPNVNFTVIPSSRKVYNRLLKEKILEIFVEAGANVESSNCGPCFGKHMGVLDKSAQMISSSNRNYIGRMGSPKAKIFLASPVTVAAAAIAGKIVDPRKYL